MAAIGVTGVAATVYLSVSATFKAAEVLSETGKDADWKEKLAKTWRLYIPAGVVAASTAVSIIWLNHIGVRRAAAATALYTVTESAFDDYKAHVVEHIGENAERKIRDKIAQDVVSRHKPDEIVETDKGDVLFYDSITGRYFTSTMESVKRAQANLHVTILKDMYASLSEFYEEIGLMPTAYSDLVGWDTDNPIQISFSTTLTDDGRPCIVLVYDVVPFENYDSFR